MVRRSRTITNCMGRRRKFFGRWGPELFREAYAQIPQSTVGDIINSRGILPMYNDQEIFYPVELLNQIHDSIPFQMSYERYSWVELAFCLHTLKDLMEQPIPWRGREFMIPLEIKAGFNLTELKVFELRDTVEESADRLGAFVEELKQERA